MKNKSSALVDEKLALSKYNESGLIIRYNAEWSLQAVIYEGTNSETMSSSTPYKSTLVIVARVDSSLPDRFLHALNEFS